MSVLKLDTPRRSAQSLRAVPDARRKPALVISSTLGIGTLLIVVLGLFLSVWTQAGVYEIAGLKNEKKNLTESVQILSAQVDSLSSAQNLSGAAQKLGMVANANPVFLNVTAKKIYGKPMAAIKSSQGRITRNLVPNAQLHTTTNIADLKQTPANEVAATDSNVPLKQASGQNSNVATATSTQPRVISSGDKLPGSPTN